MRRSGYWALFISGGIKHITYKIFNNTDFRGKYVELISRELLRSRELLFSKDNGGQQWLTPNRPAR